MKATLTLCYEEIIAAIGLHAERHGFVAKDVKLNIDPGHDDGALGYTPPSVTAVVEIESAPQKCQPYQNLSRTTMEFN